MALTGVFEDTLSLDVRRGLCERLLKKAVVAAATAACAKASPDCSGGLHSHIEEVKVQAGLAMGKKAEATIRELQQNLAKRLQKELAKEVKETNMGRRACAQSRTALPERFAHALSAPLKNDANDQIMNLVGA